MGTLIVLEGIDGSGKSTQFDILCDRLASENKDFKHVRFPRYDKPSSTLLKMYLGGEFGDDPDTVNAYAATSFFAVDRFASFVQDWRGYYNGGGLVLLDRYTTSNAIHQGAKLTSCQRGRFFDWLYEYEFNLIGLPAPDHVIYMDIDAENAARRLAQRQAETGTSGDIHEKDMAYLKLCAQSGAQAATHYGWHSIGCITEGHERSENELHQEIWQLVQEYI